MLQKEEQEDTENYLVAQYEPTLTQQLKPCIAFQWQGWLWEQRQKIRAQ